MAESFDKVIKGWSGQDSPRDTLQKDLNPPAHGFADANPSNNNPVTRVISGGGTPGKLGTNTER